jgi:cytochrome subunit of sulfide dehydrogenase
MNAFRFFSATALLVVLTDNAFAAPADIPAGAAACSGCHPAKAGVDSPVPRLVGRDPATIAAAMAQFQSGARPSTVMGRIAKGFTEDEIKAIAAWYGAQKD